MINFNNILQNKDVTLFPAIQDSYAYILSKLNNNNRILFVANESKNLPEMMQQIEFFCPNTKIILLPEWDCLAYDKMSPSANNLAQRIRALNDLASQDYPSIICLTSIEAVAQKLPPKDLFIKIAIKLSVGENIKRDEFISQLLELGYYRVEIASVPGDFAVRGDIIDIVSNLEEGWRLDFFCNKLERIRVFDLSSQTSIGKNLHEINLLPSNEIVFNEQAIKLFYNNFIDHKDNPIFDAIENGRKYPGMEHYLPYFYPYLSTIFDYTSPTHIIFESEYNEQFKKFYCHINTNYESRKFITNNHFKDEIPYYPVNPEELWLSYEALTNYLSNVNLIKLNHFTLDTASGIDLKIKKMDNFELLSKSQKISSFDLLKEYRDKNKLKIIIACKSEGSMQRVRNILDNYNIHSFTLNAFSDYKKISGKNVATCILNLQHGFSYEDFAIVTEQDLLGEKIVRKKASKNIENLLAEVNSLQIGEYVVHKQHGIGLFSGLETVKAVNLEHDCLKLLYEGGDVLYIPVENLELLSRYGSSDEEIKLDKLGGLGWQHRKEKLKEKIKIIAGELIKTAALRAKKEGCQFVPQDLGYEEFCKKFPYLETEDQVNSINEVLEDLASGRPMDRLICGDVGFGKTEIALRAAFVVTNPQDQEKKQVAIIVPTTLLARQHYHSFFKRFSGFNVRVKQISRLVNAKEIKQIKIDLKEGAVDIVIGTHALLAKDIEFKNLGLLIIDEEQRFGVMQKEKLKKLQNNVHILTLSATPIPRTLQMSLTGVKDLSIIATPPIDRQVVKTYIMNYDSVALKEAILREFYRGGQIFFVCPRISDIEEILPKLRELVPEVKVVVAHGQMSSTNLEEIMTDFCNKKFQLLLSTSIVESGIDIPEANTIIIHRADKFGLSALYQLRGRVGRSNVKAFAYLLLPNKKLTKLASARLEVMQTLDTLGAGFTVASHDMDIRGFGNLVGDEQSGHIREVGIELYQQMLQDAISELKNSDISVQEDKDYSPQINLEVPVIIPEEYVNDLNLRLSLYKNLANFNTIAEVDQFAVQMIDRFGTYPIEVEYLLETIKLKIKAKHLHIEKIDAGAKAIVVGFRNNQCINPDTILDLVSKNLSYMKIRSDQKLLINKSFPTAKEKILYLNELLKKFECTR